MNIELGKNIDTRELETKIQKFWDDNNFWDNDVKCMSLQEKYWRTTYE